MTNNYLNKIINFLHFNFNFIQGSGGNISYKLSEDSLFIKASGKKLNDFQNENIFTTVNYKYDEVLSTIINKNHNYLFLNFLPSRPSIETFMHIILKKKCVVHLHPLSILRFLILDNYKDVINNFMSVTCIKFSLINYSKPGIELANLIYKDISSHSEKDVYFLQNHGVIIQGNTVNEILNILKLLDNIFKFEKLNNLNLIANNFSFKNYNDTYRHTYFPEINSLYTKQANNKLILKIWKSFPDSVVFLGGNPIIVSKSDLNDQVMPIKDYLIVKDNYVLVNKNASDNIDCMFLAIFYIFHSMSEESKIHMLSQKEILSLVNWEAESYRKKLN